VQRLKANSSKKKNKNKNKLAVGSISLLELTKGSKEYNAPIFNSTS
jgi:hypothetical protein